ncbi:MAG: hypothetical protein K9M45_06790 [Kiritimatiellales bacterium]|nr:hypothetical protein [Kiritimatiellales bacterium]
MTWSELPFIKYVNAVDETLDAYYGVTSDQDELEFIAQAHAENWPPDTTALRLRTTGERPTDSSSADYGGQVL